MVAVKAALGNDAKTQTHKHMSTSTHTDTAPAINPSATVATKALVKSVGELLGLQTKVANKFADTAKMLAEEATKNKLDKKGAGILLQNAYSQYYTAEGERNKLTGDALTEAVKLALAKTAPDRSKMITLAFPASEAAASELAKAKEAGLGVNAQLEVARGNKTVAEIQASRSASGASKGARPPEGDKPSTVSTPQAEASAAQSAGMTAEEKFENQVAALFALGAALKLSADKQEEIIADYYASRAEGEGEGK